ncbi:hypothetical protein [Cohnella sp. GCM10027633]|uniref:hypothetical protein n=1 Tax=unclassified Cohnella TaxID=2636738 RepID=UPI00363642CA
MAADDSFNARFEAAIGRHNKAVRGNPAAVRDAHRQFAELRAIDSQHALLEAYYGSTLAMLARDADQLIDKADKAQHSLDILDRAVAMAPGDAVVRLIRANVCMRLPDRIFDRTQTAIDDFKHLLSRDDGTPGYLAPAQRQETLQGLAQAYENAGKHGLAKTIRQQSAKPRPDAAPQGKGENDNGKQRKTGKGK